MHTDLDVFISYSSKDKAWVRSELLQRIEQTGLKAFIDFRDFTRGAPSIKECERGVASCRKTLVVLTPDYIASEWGEIENIMVQTLDPANRQLRLIPVLKAECEKPLRIGALTHVDFTDGADQNLGWDQLLNALGAPADRQIQQGVEVPVAAAYSLENLSPRSFEHLVQALAIKVIGPNITVFGDGADGGREATFSGLLAYPNQSKPWEGDGVIQAKFRQRPGATPKEDADWLLGQLNQEMKKFSPRTAPRARTRPAPDYYVLATNARLSPVAGVGGMDRVHDAMQRFQHDLGWKAFDVWEHEKISRLLDVQPEIATTFAHFITPGHILKALHDLLTFDGLQVGSITRPDEVRSLLRDLGTKTRDVACAEKCEYLTVRLIERKNPFQDVGPLPCDAPTYVPRHLDVELERILKGTGRLVCITGDFGIGKTSLMTQARRILPDHKFVGGGLADLRSEDPTRFMKNFFKLFEDQFGPVSEWDEIDYHARQCPCVLLLDDLGEVLAPGMQAMVPALVARLTQPNATLRTIATTPVRLQTLFAERHMPNEKYSKPWRVLHLSPLTPPEARHLVDLLSPQARSVAVKHMRHIELRSRFMPRRIQSLCGRLFDAEADGCSEKDFEALIVDDRNYE